MNRKIIIRLAQLNSFSLCKLLVYELYFVCIFDPFDRFHIKIIILFLFFIFFGRSILRGIVSREYIITTFMSTVFPVICVLLSIVNGGSALVAISKEYVCTYTLLLPVLLDYNVNFEKILMRYLRLLCVAILSMVVIDYFGFHDLFRSIASFLKENEIANIGTSHLVISYYKIFFKTSPLLIFLLDYEYRRSKVWTIICVTALFFSGTRANLIIMAVYLLLRTYVYNKDVIKGNKRTEWVIVAIPILAILLININRVINLLKGIMTNSNSLASDSYRFSDIYVFLTSLKDPFVLLFGRGLGASFFSMTLGTDTTGAAVDALYYLYEIGIILFAIFMGFAVYPVFKKINVGLKIALLCYLFTGFTNPMIRSSTAYIAYIYVYLNLYKSQKRTYIDVKGNHFGKDIKYA